MTKRKFINASLAIYLIAGTALSISPRGWLPDFYNPGFMGTLAFLSAITIYLPQVIFRPEKEDAAEIVLNFQATIAASLLMNGAGGLGLYQLYQYGFEYDKLMHFLVPLLLTVNGSAFVSAWYRIKIEKALFLSAILVIVGSLLWEVFEFLSDWYIGTQTLGFYGKEVTKDTIVDVIVNTIGVILGAAIVLRKK